MLGLIRKKELKRILEYLELVEKKNWDGTKEERIWLYGSLESIYCIAGYFGIELSNAKKDGVDDEQNAVD